MHIHFVLHELFEGPGALLNWATQRKCTTGFSRVYTGEQLPSSVKDIDLLVVMGGPQSPDTSLKECSYFDAEKEKAFIKEGIRAHKAVLGICLGAQLIGEALGAKYEHSPEKEIGFFPVTLTREGLQNNKFSHFGHNLEVGHWHNDMPGITANSKVMAYSEGCPKQIVEYSPLVYGFQCHMEFTPELMALLIKHSEDELKHSSLHKYVQQPATLLNNKYEEMNQKLFIFLDKLMEDYRKNRYLGKKETVS